MTENGPPLPDALERHCDTSASRIRSRSVGEPCPGVPEVVLVEGMAAAAQSGRYQELPGAHTFLWADPASWSAPVRQLALDAA